MYGFVTANMLLSLVLLIQMLPGVAYKRWLTMTILEHLDEIGT
jgi:hypothetical protein